MNDEPRAPNVGGGRQQPLEGLADNATMPASAATLMADLLAYLDRAERARSRLYGPAKSTCSQISATVPRKSNAGPRSISSKPPAPVTLQSAVSRFGAAATKKLSNPIIVGQPEDQLRGPVEGLLRDLGGLCVAEWRNQIVMVGETALKLKARPDLAVIRADLLVGFVELKAPGKGANPSKFRDRHDREQWDRLKALPNLIYTDGNEFTLWRDGHLVALAELVGDVTTAGATLDAPPELLALVRSFFLWAPTPPKNAQELAAISARLCRLLRDEVEEQLKVKSPGLAMLGTAWRKALFPDASDAQFADGYAQAVTFGMLMARANGIGLDDLNRAGQRLGDTLIGTALRVLTFSDTTNRPITALRTLTRVLDAVEWSKVSGDDPDAWLYFYEEFLATYDGELRKQTGSYYTPPEVVGEMVRLVDDVLRTRFDLQDGLASTAVTLADPAMGTGTFLLGVLRKIAAIVEADQGSGAVGPAIDGAVQRLIAFDKQLGPYAVAQLRLLAELRDLGGTITTPRMYIADTLANPFVEQEWLGPFMDPIAESQREANRIKKDERIMVVLGNPPYKDKAKALGGWIVSGDKKEGPQLDAWVPPKAMKQGTHVRHLHNLYVYFWRWATWKAFDQYPDSNTGIVCFVSSAAFLNGAAFEMMREYLRQRADEIWVFDCSPEGEQKDVNTRFFEGVQRAVCIVLACRSAQTDEAKPARVRFRALAEGRRELKFDSLRATQLDDPTQWSECATEWRAPFRPTTQSAWLTYPSLQDIFAYDGNGSMIGRTWVVAPDVESLELRWSRLVAAPADEKSALFQPHTRGGKPGDRHVDKVLGSGLPGFATPTRAVADEDGPCPPSVPYAFRAFDRQYIIPDNRLINVPNMTIWETRSNRQVFITAPMDRAPTGGPALTVTGLVPDAHHYNGRGGRVFMLWSDADAAEPNIRSGVLDQLRSKYGRDVVAEDVFAYIVAISAHPAFTTRFRDDLAKPGIRIPFTDDAALFAEGIALGQQVVWVQTFGERFTNAKEGRPRGSPRLKEAPKVPAGGAIGADGRMPDEMKYDEEKARLYIGRGYVDGVSAGVWGYEVSGMSVLRQWFSYRSGDRERPTHGRRASLLSEIKPAHWPADYTAELLRLINVLGRLVELEPAQATLLDRVCAGETITFGALKELSEGNPKTSGRTRAHPSQMSIPGTSEPRRRRS